MQQKIIIDMEENILTTYICNVCGDEHDTERDAVYCHPDIFEKKYVVKTYKNRAGKEVEFIEKELEDED